MSGVCKRSGRLVAIAPFLISSPDIITLGVRTSLGDYSPAERDLLLSSDRIFFPTPRFVSIFEAAGKDCFPSGIAYRIHSSRVVQEALLRFFDYPHPRSRIYFGKQKHSITRHFKFPFRAMGPGAASCVRLITDTRELEQFSKIHNPLIVQEVVEYEKQFRAVFVNFQVAGIVEGNSENDRVWRKVVADVGKLLRPSNLNDVCVEVGFTSGTPQIIALSRPPRIWESPSGRINRHEYISRLVETGEL